MPITMTEIARQAGVSQPVVSAVLNDNFENCRVSDEKKDLIMKIARENHYIPNAAARSLKTRRTGVINVVIPSGSFFQVPHYNTIIAGLQEYMETAGYRLNFTSLSFGYKDYRQLSGLMADAIVVFYWGATNDPVIQELKRLDMPVVAVYGRCSVPGVHNLYFDNRTAMYGFAAELIRRGHTTIGYVPLYTGDIFHQEGLDGIRQACAEYPEVRLREYQPLRVTGRIYEPERFFRAGMDSVSGILGEAGRPSVLIYNHDTVAMGAMQYVRDQGISVPGSLSVAGCGNDPYSALWTPALTTIDLRPREFGAALGMLLPSVIKNPKGGFVRRAFVPEACFRESVT